MTKLDDQNSDERGKDDVVQFDEATEKKLTEYEETMRHIKEATGVSDITEVIAKFQSQGDTLHHLSHLQKTNEERMEHLKKQKTEVIREYEQLRFTGEAKQSHSQRTLEEFKNHLEEAQAKFIESKSKYERNLKSLGSTKAGIQHLSEKLESIRLVLFILHSLTRIPNQCWSMMTLLWRCFKNASRSLKYWPTICKIRSSRRYQL